MSPSEACREAAARLRAAQIPDAREEAGLLLAHLTGGEPMTLRLDTDTVLPDETLRRYRELTARRAGHEPLQYLTGEAFFLGRVFHVDSRVLIPRPETEQLVRLAAERLRAFPDGRLLDLCCGSGCIAVSAALEVPGSAIWASDLSEGALETARGNAERLGAAVRFAQGDLFCAVGQETFDVIVTNPPYIPTEVCETLQSEVLREPHMALDGGADGLDFYRRIAEGAPAHLNGGGWLLAEVGWDQAEAVAELWCAAGLNGVEIRADFRGIGRNVIGQKLNHTEGL